MNINGINCLLLSLGLKQIVHGYCIRLERSRALQVQVLFLLECCNLCYTNLVKQVNNNIIKHIVFM